MNETGVAGFFQGTGMPNPDWWEALWPDPVHVLTLVGIQSGMEVVDLCCGDGWFTLPIARIARHTIAIDIDGKLLKAARRRLDDNNVKNCDYVEGNANDVDRLVKHPVDFVFLSNVFHGVPDKPHLCRAVRAILKPHGLFAIINWYARPREQTSVLGQARGPETALRMTPEATVAAVELSGFRLRNIDQVSPYHYGSVFTNSH